MYLFVFVTDRKRLTSNQVACLKICKICFSSMLYKTALDQGLLFEAKGFLMPPFPMIVRYSKDKNIYLLSRNHYRDQLYKTAV